MRKNSFSVFAILVFFGLLIGLLVSCATSASVFKPLSEVPNVEILGSVYCNFIAGGTDEIGTNERAYTALLGEAKKNMRDLLM